MCYFYVTWILIKLLTDAVARVNATYGQGGTVINLDNLDCTGDEPRLIDCPFPAGHDCTHAEDAGVDCSTVCKFNLYTLVTHKEHDIVLNRHL